MYSSVVFHPHNVGSNDLVHGIEDVRARVIEYIFVQNSSLSTKIRMENGSAMVAPPC